MRNKNRQSRRTYHHHFLDSLSVLPSTTVARLSNESVLGINCCLPETASASTASPSSLEQEPHSSSGSSTSEVTHEPSSYLSRTSRQLQSELINSSTLVSYDFVAHSAAELELSPTQLTHRCIVGPVAGYGTAACPVDRSQT